MRQAEFYTYVYESKADRKGHKQFFIKIPKATADALRLRHKQLVKVVIMVVDEVVKQ